MSRNLPFVRLPAESIHAPTTDIYACVLEILVAVGLGVGLD